jgi:hypothetical protein
MEAAQEGGLPGEYIEPKEQVSFRNFAVMLVARIGAFVKHTLIAY